MRSTLLVLVLVFGGAVSIQARDPNANREIEFLLNYVATSNARFIRNGSEYSAKESADHLRDKLSRAGERVKSAEDFIKGVASKSYLSGKPYLVKTQGGQIVATGPWLMQALVQHRLR